MANNGILQATIAYKTSTDGQPVDVDGNLTSISGKRQAIALLEGYANPNPVLYEVELYYKAGEYVDGVPSVKLDGVFCPVHYIRFSTDKIVLTPDNNAGEFTVFSSAGWNFTGSPNVATISPTSGYNGATVISVIRNDTIGAYRLFARNSASGQEAELNIVNVNSIEWVLTTGEWNNLGFWQANGIWNY